VFVNRKANRVEAASERAISSRRKARAKDGKRIADTSRGFFHRHAALTYSLLTALVCNLPEVTVVSRNMSNIAVLYFLIVDA
jgi:hypothetical protein